MEVKIKQGEEMIDAIIEMVDGVMVVSPKWMFEPKNGDVIVCSNNLGYWTLIVREMESYNVVRHHAVLINNGILKINDRSSYTNPRYATEEEKKKLFDKLAEEGLEWDAEKKELVKLKWKPKEGEIFHFPIFSDELGEFVTDYQEYYETIFMSIERDWCFKTSKECQEFCNRLNDAISQVKP